MDNKKIEYIISNLEQKIRKHNYLNIVKQINLNEIITTLINYDIKYNPKNIFYNKIALILLNDGNNKGVDYANAFEYGKMADCVELNKTNVLISCSKTKDTRLLNLMKKIFEIKKQQSQEKI